VNNPQDPIPGSTKPVRRAGLMQVVATIFFSFVMIGKKGTWEKDGAQVTPGQIIVGGLIGAAVLVGSLLLLVRLVLKLAMV
jgi:hypothetical protein